MFLNTLTWNLCLVRVHAFVPREISLLQSQNLPVRFSTSSMQSVQADVENSQETARPQTSARSGWSSESSVVGWPHAENSRSTLRSYRSGLEPAFSSKPAIFRIASSGFARWERAAGFGFGWTLLPVSRKRLGLVPDGCKALPSQSSHLSRPCAPARQGESSWLVSGDRDHPASDTQTDPSLDLRRDFRNYQAWQEPGLDRAALPLSSYQPLAKLPRPTQSQIGGQTIARSALPKCAASSRSPRWSTVAKRAQKTAASYSASNTIACHAHDRSRVSQADRPFQSLSEISTTASSNYHRQRRSYESTSSRFDAPDTKHKNPSRITSVDHRSDSQAAHDHV